MFDRWDSAGLPTGFRDVGNATLVSLAPEEETLEHYSSREGIKTLDLEVTLSRKLKGKFTVDEYDKRNLQLCPRLAILEHKNASKSVYEAYNIIFQVSLQEVNNEKKNAIA